LKVEFTFFHIFDRNKWKNKQETIVRYDKDLRKIG